MPKEPCVYILTNTYNKVLYTGVTSDIVRRIQEHKEGQGSVFTRRYNLTKIVFLQHFPNMFQAIQAEKAIKGGSRARKIALIEAMNPDWHDLAENLR